MEHASTDDGDAPEPVAHQPRKTRKRWLSYGLILLSVLVGILIGVGSFTFGYGKGASYLSNDPQTCVNCHVMQDHFDSWQHSSHHHVAVCNDCHLPHDAIGKWVTKADNGFFHSLAFTVGDYKNPIQIKPRNKRVTQSTCISCHRDFVHSMLPVAAEAETQSCVHCHADVGHVLR
ncbi:cytochrome c nitrite reductase small subunit [Rhodopirellula sp. SM50]|nr:cytochrome c nitrite reductase small subunit [Rhodopirellula sp. SM50]PAY17525.1 cytochrome c nitrite reductase small subunit [Rhodopirellula sp. SM50]